MHKLQALPHTKKVFVFCFNLEVKDKFANFSVCCLTGPSDKQPILPKAAHAQKIGIADVSRAVGPK